MPHTEGQAWYQLILLFSLHFLLNRNFGCNIYKVFLLANIYQQSISSRLLTFLLTASRHSVLLLIFTVFPFVGLVSLRNLRRALTVGLIGCFISLNVYRCFYDPFRFIQSQYRVDPHDHLRYYQSRYFFRRKSVLPIDQVNIIILVVHEYLSAIFCWCNTEAYLSWTPLSVVYSKSERYFWWLSFYLPSGDGFMIGHMLGLYLCMDVHKYMQRSLFCSSIRVKESEKSASLDIRNALCTCAMAWPLYTRRFQFLILLWTVVHEDPSHSLFWLAYGCTNMWHILMLLLQNCSIRLLWLTTPSCCPWKCDQWV